MVTRISSSSQISTCKAPFVEVKATAGSGKTHTLIMRLKHLADIGVPADKILVLSFSKETVAELLRRFERFSVKSSTPISKPLGDKLLNVYMSRVTVQTTHAFANSLCQETIVVREKKAASLLAMAIKAVKQDLKDGILWPDLSRNGNSRRMKQLTELSELGNRSFILNFFAVARASKSTLRKAAEREAFRELRPYLRVLRAVRTEYAAIKKEKRLVDFGDMLYHATNAIKDGGVVPFTHVLVDEYQDCSPAQVHFLAEVAKLDGRNIMVFGDPGQAIYGFGGSTYTPLSSMLDGVQELSLPRSRRLTKQNAALASAVLQLRPENAICAGRSGELPALIHATTETEQIEFLAQDIKELIDGGTRPERIALLARTKALLAPVEQTLLATGVHTTRRGTSRDRKHMLRVLRLIHLVKRAEEKKAVIAPEELQSTFSHMAGVSNSRWRKASVELKKVTRSTSLEGRYRLCAKVYLRLRGGVRKDADLRADVNRWETLCRDFSDAKSMRDAVCAMGKATVITGTIHSVKGGEWDHVFIAGVTDGYLPIYHAKEDEHALCEERNLLYVAVTRARETVRLYHSPANNARSRQRFKRLSRFIDPVVRNTLRIVRAPKSTSRHSND